jgi:NAD(P)H dehydrogenase (quinone)
MKATIILAHPWHGSFNKSIMDALVFAYEKKNKEYQIIDLNKENFNPVLRENELALYAKGSNKDENVQKYQNMLMESDELVFIFPIWWYALPAILKGFLDKVMLKNFAYSSGKLGLKGLLTHVKKTMVITTSQAPTWYLKFVMGNPIQRSFIKGTLKCVGLKNVKWFNNGHITTATDQSRKKFLEKAARYI